MQKKAHAHKYYTSVHNDRKHAQTLVFTGHSGTHLQRMRLSNNLHVFNINYQS